MHKSSENLPCLTKPTIFEPLTVPLQLIYIHTYTLHLHKPTYSIVSTTTKTFFPVKARWFEVDYPLLVCHSRLALKCYVSCILPQCMHACMHGLDLQAMGHCDTFTLNSIYLLTSGCKTETKINRVGIYTGTTSAFWFSSQVRIRPSTYVGRRHRLHWQPIEIGSDGGAIMSNLSWRRTTPITLTVLPSFM